MEVLSMSFSFVFQSVFKELADMYGAIYHQKKTVAALSSVADVQSAKGTKKNDGCTDHHRLRCLLYVSKNEHFHDLVHCHHVGCCLKAKYEVRTLHCPLVDLLPNNQVNVCKVSINERETSEAPRRAE